MPPLPPTPPSDLPLDATPEAAPNLARPAAAETGTRSSASDAASGLPGAGRAWLPGLTLALWAAFAVSVFVHPRSAADLWLDVVLYNAIILGAAAMCLGRALADRSGAWLLLGVVQVLWIAGSVVDSLVYRRFDEPPHPSIADVCWYAAYGVLFIALGLLLRPHLRHRHRSMWLDFVVVALGLAAICATFVFGPVRGATAGEAAAVAYNLVYPIADVVVVGVALGAMVALGQAANRAFHLLAAAGVLLTVADGVFLFADARGVYREGGALDTLWPLALVCIGLAAWIPARATRPSGERSWLLAVPAGVGLVALLIIGWGLITPIMPIASAFALATLLMAGVRTLSTFSAVRQLATSQEEARTDVLTGLANRRRFAERLAAATANTSPSLTVVLIDLDGFKEVNDSFGHLTGDRLLRLIAERLEDAVDDRALLARFGGDEFALLLPDGDLAAARRTTDELRELLRVPFDLDGLRLFIDASFGIAAIPYHTESADDVVSMADIAMYAAKRNGHHIEVFSSVRDNPHANRIELLEDLRRGIARQELMLHYQPKIDLATGRVCSAEALVRWQHPTYGLLQPAAFVDLAESSGLMTQLTMHVLGAALDACAWWHELGLDLGVAVNVSTSNLLDLEFPDMVARQLATHDVAPGLLTLEITESSVIVDQHRCLDVLHRLRELGVRLSIDDYGTGHSTLAYVRELPVDELKVDRSFVTHMATDERSDAIVRATVGLAHALGVLVVAEGAETDEVLARLLEIGCDMAQGYGVARPLPGADLVAFVTARDRPAPSRAERALTPAARAASRTAP